jgi:hypothetical protein
MLLTFAIALISFKPGQDPKGKKNKNEKSHPVRTIILPDPEFMFPGDTLFISYGKDSLIIKPWKGILHENRKKIDGYYLWIVK